MNITILTHLITNLYLPKMNNSHMTLIQNLLMIQKTNNIELMPSHSSHSSENPTQLSYPSENSIQPSYQPKHSSQSSYPFKTITQHSQSSQSSQLETLKPNISPQQSQSIKKLKTHSTIIMIVIG